MGKTDVRFFYYKIICKDEHRKKIDFSKELNSKELIGNKITLDGDGGKQYTFSFRDMSDNFFYGQIIRSRSNSKYSTLLEGESSWSPLNQKAGKGITSENESDKVNFVIGCHEKDIIFLIQRGFQYPGAKILTSFFNTFFKTKKYAVHYEQLKTEKLKKVLQNLLTQNKVGKVIFRLNSTGPNLPEDEKWGIVKSLRKLSFDGFELIIELRLKKRARGLEEIKTKASDVLRKIFKIPEGDEITQALGELDLPQYFSSISVTSETLAGGEETHNILDQFEQEKISFDRSAIDLEESLINTLIESLKAKILTLSKGD